MKSQSSLSILQIAGSEAETYLQNLLTADIRTVADGHWTNAAFCSPQGKVQAMLRIARIEKNYFVLIPETLSESIAKRWKLFSLNRPVQLIPRAELEASAVGGTERSAALENNRLSFGGINGFTAADNIAARFAQILPATQDQFLPQMLGLEENGGLSYAKGCYIGQEIIARAHSRAPVRRHLQLLQSETAQNSPLAAGDTLYAEEQAAANIIESYIENDRLIALAVVQDRYADSLLSDAQGNRYYCL